MTHCFVAKTCIALRARGVKTKTFRAFFFLANKTNHDKYSSNQKIYYEVFMEETIPALAPGVIENVMIKGDLSKLNDTQRLSYYQNLCKSLGLNPLTKPFEYITLNNKLVLYATRSCTDQLRFNHHISIVITSREIQEQIYVVTAKATTANGRTDESVGAVSIANLKGNDLANALMKAETKAKRRVALSVCGLGFIDETEVETIPNAQKVPTAEEVYNGTAKPLVYTAPFGKYKDMKIEDIEENALKNYVSFLEEKALAKGEKLSSMAQEFVELAKAHLGNKNLDEGYKETMMFEDTGIETDVRF